MHKHTIKNSVATSGVLCGLFMCAAFVAVPTYAIIDQQFTKTSIVDITDRKRRTELVCNVSDIRF